ncbi:hypothetical protein OG889_20510 [Streptomyces sp. NBC_00481]|uniref:hypothetical protein n=1 Tax=Streptomyces sp. NBC_00481 TaxID=2975755 RepID=UPI002DD8729F|nr:hypothetical protein [Streptomyces sp. NBC_00481]WRY96908.1 hypothetical protein OG889_20510 [Streptomyces sp. NBC_00481]
MDSPQRNAIGEPEVIEGFPEAPAPAPGPDAAGDEAPSAPGTRRVKAWMRGGLGGVVAASIVWGSGLYAFGLPGTPGTPGTVGYRVADKLCAKTLWPGLSTRFVKGTDWLSSVTKHPAMDTADCFGELRTFGGGMHSGQLHFSVVLHKQTDLTGEFEARRAGTRKRFAAGGGGGVTEVHRVPGLADHAYLVTNDFGNGSHWMQLNVLDGRAEFTLGLTTRALGDVSPPPTPKEIEPLLIKDMKDVMSSLGTSG